MGHRTWSDLLERYNAVVRGELSRWWGTDVNTMGRRLPGHLRRPRPGDPLRPGGHRSGHIPRYRGPMRPPHRGGGDSRIRRGGGGSPHRGPDRGAGRTERSGGITDGQGSGGRERVRVPFPERAHPEGDPGSLGDLRGGGKLTRKISENGKNLPRLCPPAHSSLNMISRRRPLCAAAGWRAELDGVGDGFVGDIAHAVFLFRFSHIPPAAEPPPPHAGRPPTPWPAPSPRRFRP